VIPSQEPSVPLPAALDDLPFALDLPDVAIHSDELPWIPITDRSESRFLRFDLAHGTWVEIFRMHPGSEVARHRHVGGPVLGYCLEGSWRYLERGWTARPGTLVYEPPGDVHTLVPGPEGMTTLFVISGSIQYLGPDDAIVAQDDVQAMARLYLEHCRLHGLEPVDLAF